MTYNPFTGMLWQVNVGGDNCIFEMDPVSRLSTGGKICPPFGTSERGLAFDPITNTYYAGSWNDGIINHFAPDGTLLDSAAVGLSISGLAFNPSSGHLFVLTNRMIEESTFDVYVLDTQDAYAILGGFDVLDGVTNVFSDFSQAGLEIDCDGNLWAVDTVANKVYVAGSGETGVCDWPAEWLAGTPAGGSVLAESQAGVVVTADSSSLPTGIYQAYLRIVSNTPYEDVIVPLTFYNSEPIFLPFIGH
jgi:DNA-binding beta-propeller fold protein YncE